MPKMTTEVRQALLASVNMDKDLIAVDPRGCGCTECLTGEYIPMHLITRDRLHMYSWLVAMGALVDNTDGELPSFDNPIDEPAEENSERNRVRRILTDHVGSGTQFCVNCGWRPEMSFGDKWRLVDERMALREHQLDLIMGAEPVPRKEY